MDARSLGAFRIAFGLVLLSDLARRWVELQFWYTNSGLLPNHTLLWRPPAERMFSLFFTLSNAREAQIGFVLCLLSYLAFTLGYRTRWAQVLALVARVSLNSRLAVLENGGDMAMDLLCLLTLPLPLGARFSLDAVAAAKAEQPAPKQPVVSIAVFGLLLQFAVIYFFNAISKDGTAWRNGEAVHYALHLDKLVTWPGVWMREQLSPAVLATFTHAVLATEWLGFALIVTPVFTP
ncbi:MAG TPA: HTTM domain-containing protein, partial [Polyangiaceae bacterium]